VATVDATGNITGVGPGTATISYFIAGTGSCPDALATLDVTVNPTPQITVTYTDTICDGSTTDIVVTGNPTYVWDATITNIDGSAYQVSGNETDINQVVNLTDSLLVGTITMSITPTANNCRGASQLVQITIRPIPVITDMPVRNTNVCTGDNVYVNISGDPNGTTYQWVAVLNGVTVVSGGTSGTTTGPIDITVATTSPTATGTIYFELTPVNGICTGAPVVTQTITVNPIPGTPIPSPDVTICSGESPNITLSV
ncbi:hypothetical protein ACFS5J_03945, partial [Flavobacterium chuncheonense]